MSMQDILAALVKLDKLEQQNFLGSALDANERE